MNIFGLPIANGLLVCALVLSLVSAKYAIAEKIELLTGLAKPPFIVNKHEGIQIELITHALASQDIEVNFTLMPLGRNVNSFVRWDFDGIITLPPHFSHRQVHLSAPYVRYQNVAVTLADNNFEINEIDQLIGRSIVAFQGARTFLGSKYKEITAYSTDYREVANQKQQIGMLFSGRTDVIVLENHIFEYLTREQDGPLYQKSYIVHKIFPEINYVAGFKSQTLADKFNQGILQLKATDQYREIINKYIY